MSAELEKDQLHQEVYLYWTQTFYLNPTSTISYQPGDRVKMKTLFIPKSRFIEVEVAFLVDKKGREEIVALERIRIAKKKLGS
jgi:hypothetical protein